ncbi:MAG: insulinase family protein [Corallococcus sp.]|nr:insulinase family protein [Corallococcus sp.]MCM1359154.1 insulinase family protein [Corallococcus sp.]MCM1394544.1 insulinase family protein [Corallococcus sp.]
MEFFKQYPSGLKIIAKRLDNFHTVCFGIYVNVGSVREDVTTNGMSHLIEHMLFKGTDRRTALQISEEMDDIGANVNAFTAKDCTCFYTKSVSDDLEKCMDILSDMYFDASFPVDELQREKQVILEEIKMCEDTPDDVSQDLISQAIFNKQPLGQTILGNAQVVEYSDRHNIENFKDLHYIPKNTVLSVAGDFNFETLDKLVMQYFESEFKVKYAETTPEPVSRYTSQFIAKFKDIEQVHLEYAVPTCSATNDERHAVSLLASILGGGSSSRLFQSIREQNGLAYNVYAYPSFYSSCGMLEIYAALGQENVTKVCQLLQKDICTLLNDGVTHRELERAKTQAVNGLYMGTEGNMTLMRLYGRNMLKFGRVFNVEEEVERYRSVTLNDVNSVAQRLFAQKAASSYLGKKIKGYELISQLDFSKR